MDHKRSTNYPLQLTAKGVKTLLDRGGVVIVYRPDCPSCQKIHQHRRSDTMTSELASVAHPNVMVGVVNQTRWGAGLPNSLAHQTVPAIFITPPGGHSPVLYTGARTADAIMREYEKLRLGPVYDRLPPPGEPSLLERLQVSPQQRPDILAAARRALAITREQHEPEPLPLSLSETNQVLESNGEVIVTESLGETSEPHAPTAVESVVPSSSGRDTHADLSRILRGGAVSSLLARAVAQNVAAGR